MTEWVGDAVHGHPSHVKKDWTPKVGDKVTVAGDDREWTFNRVIIADVAEVCWESDSGNDGYWLIVLLSMLTPVEPTP